MDVANNDTVNTATPTRVEAAGNAPATTAAKAHPGFLNSPGAQLIGEIVGLLSQSPAHRHLFLADLEWLIAPPMALRQFRIFHHDQKPIAVALWASVSDEVDKELAAGRARLRPDEWKSGKNLWLIDLVAPSIPHGSKAAEVLVQEMANKGFQGQRFKMRVLDGKTGKLKVLDLQTKDLSNIQ